MSDSYRATLPDGLAAELRARRKQLGLTYTEAADRVGIARGYLANLEAGMRCPAAAVAVALTTGLGLDADLASRLRAVARPDAGRSWHRRDLANAGVG